jgi:outer membrane receptor protein involved in Fe transport
VETARDGYVTLDTGIGWRFSPALELRLVVRNLTNAYHFGSADAVSSLAPGRSVMIGINR